MNDGEPPFGVWEYEINTLEPFLPERGKGHKKEGGNYWKSNTASRAEQLPTTPIPPRTLE